MEFLTPGRAFTGLGGVPPTLGFDPVKRQLLNAVQLKPLIATGKQKLAYICLPLQFGCQPRQPSQSSLSLLHQLMLNLEVMLGRQSFGDVFQSKQNALTQTQSG
jgi:hypothetical protein